MWRNVTKCDEITKMRFELKVVQKVATASYVSCALYVTYLHADLHTTCAIWSNVIWAKFTWNAHICGKCVQIT